MEINHERLLERFVSYVNVDTTANAETTEYPSTPGQLVLGRMLLAELSEMGLQDAHQDSNGLVWATLPSNIVSEANCSFKCIGLVSPVMPANAMISVSVISFSKEAVIPSFRSSK